MHDENSTRRNFRLEKFLEAKITAANVSAAKLLRSFEKYLVKEVSVCRKNYENTKNIYTKNVTVLNVIALNNYFYFIFETAFLKCQDFLNALLFSYISKRTSMCSLSSITLVVP